MNFNGFLTSAKANWLSIYPHQLPVMVIAVIGLTVLVNQFQHKYWNHPYRVIESDVAAYYAYLPAFFIQGDMEFRFVEGNADKYKNKLWLISTNTGKKAVITTMGMAMLYTPFFLAGHAAALILHYEADGYTAPYKFALVMGALVYLIIGLYYLKKLLEKYFSPWITSLTILVTVLGTNLYFYGTREMTMSHLYSFTLITTFVYFTIQWHKKPTLRTTLLVGFLSGLITLVRPSNILVLLILILWDVGSFRDLGNRVVYFIRSYKLVLVMVLAFIAVWVPQFIYWHSISGSIFFNSYGHVGGKFFFNNPQIYHVLFSYRKGWMVYTPIMVFALLGIFLMLKYHRRHFVPVFFYTAFNLYVISSWWCWWYGGGYSQRSFVDQYSLLALGFANTLYWAIHQKRLIIYPIIGLFTLLSAFNLFQIAQYNQGAIHYVSMTEKAYWATFLKLKPTQQFKDELIWPDYDAARYGVYYTPNELTDKQKKDQQKKLITIQNLIDEIKSKPDLMESIIKKASERNISVDSMIYLDAVWLYNNYNNE